MSQEKSKSAASNKKEPIDHGLRGKYIHEVKGPAVLTANQIKDIVESRPVPDARKKMAAKYGISVVRVTNLWKQYYGGSTLKDYASGLKIALPTESIKTADINMRKFKSERGVYTAKEPKSIAQKAVSVRKLNPNLAAKQNWRQDAESKSSDLELIPEEVTNEDAEIMAGEVTAGNNNEELLETIYEVLEHNHNLSTHAISALENALDVVSRNKYMKSRYNNKKLDESDYESNYESDNIDDDSTVDWKKKKSPFEPKINDKNAGRESDKIRHEVREEFANSPDSGVQHSPAVLLAPGGANRLVGSNTMGKNLWEGSSGLGARAQPIYRTVGAADVREEQANTGQTSGRQPQIPQTEYDPRQRFIQPHNSHNNLEQYPQSVQSAGLYSAGGAGSRQTVPGAFWVKRR